MEYSAYIYLDAIKICKISYFDNDLDTYEYVFEPLYQVLDTLNPTEFKGIQGIDLRLRICCLSRLLTVPEFTACFYI